MIRVLSFSLRAAVLGVAAVVMSRLVAERRFQSRLARPYGPWPDVPAGPVTPTPPGAGTGS